MCRHTQAMHHSTCRRATPADPCGWASTTVADTVGYDRGTQQGIQRQQCPPPHLCPIATMKHKSIIRSLNPRRTMSTTAVSSICLGISNGEPTKVGCHLHYISQSCSSAVPAAA